MILESELSTSYPPNPGQVTYSDDQTETTGNRLGDCYEAKIDHNHPKLQMIREMIKE